MLPAAFAASTRSPTFTSEIAFDSPDSTVTISDAAKHAFLVKVVNSGTTVGPGVGLKVGLLVGVGAIVGVAVVGVDVGEAVGAIVGVDVGEAVGAIVGD